MKKAIIAVLLVGVALVGIYGCAKVADSGGGGNITPSSTVGTLTGTITLSDQTAGNYNGVTVSITGVASTAVTNADGWFAIANVAVGTNKILNLSKTGYISSQQIVNIEGGRTTHITSGLIAQASALSLTVSAGGTLTSGATSVTFPPDALVLASGTGTVTTASVAITETTFATTADADAFPGDFTGTTTGGAVVPFESYGWIDMNATGSGTLKIADGKSVSVTMANKGPIPDAGVTEIPVWYFDHATATWKAITDASGNQIMATYNAATNSFTYTVPGGGQWAVLGGDPWNVDRPMDVMAFIKGRVLDGNGNPVANASIRVYTSLNNWRWQTTAGDYTLSDGTFGPIRVPPGRDFYVVAQSGAKRSAAKSFSGISSATYPSTSPMDCGDFLLEASRLIFTMTWNLDPGDLDSHITIPNAASETDVRYHLYYSNRGSTPSGSYPYANLDVDDQDGYGPENTSVYRLYPGKYRFCVHHYAGSSSIQDSGAQVILSTDDGSGTFGSYTFTPPAGQPLPSLKQVWEVCDIKVNSSGRIEWVNALNAYGSQEAGTYNPDGLHDQVWSTGITSVKDKK